MNPPITLFKWSSPLTLPTATATAAALLLRYTSPRVLGRVRTLAPRFYRVPAITAVHILPPMGSSASRRPIFPTATLLVVEFLPAFPPKERLELQISFPT